MGVMPKTKLVPIDQEAGKYVLRRENDKSVVCVETAGGKECKDCAETTCPHSGLRINDGRPLLVERY